MRKILYVDYLSPVGHINYNNNQLRAICSSDKNIVDFAARQGYHEKVDVITHKNIIIPERYYKNTNNRFLIIICYIKILYFIKSIEKKYDTIIFSSYIALPHLFIRFKNTSFLVNHYNTCYLDRRRVLMLKYLSTFYNHVVLNNDIMIYLESIGIQSTVVNHGFRNIRKKKKSVKKWVITPTTTLIDDNFMCSLLSNKSFEKYLINNNLTYYVKGNFQSNLSNVIILNGYLEDQHYKDLVYNSKGIILPYSSAFKHRVSGVLFEAFGADVPIYLSKIDAFLAYRDYFLYNPYFSDPENLVECLKNNHLDSSFYKDIEKEIPKWDNILK